MAQPAGPSTISPCPACHQSSFQFLSNPPGMQQLFPFLQTRRAVSQLCHFASLSLLTKKFVWPQDSQSSFQSQPQHLVSHGAFPATLWKLSTFRRSCGLSEAADPSVPPQTYRSSMLRWGMS